MQSPAHAETPHRQHSPATSRGPPVIVLHAPSGAKEKAREAGFCRTSWNPAWCYQCRYNRRRPYTPIDEHENRPTDVQRSCRLFHVPTSYHARRKELRMSRLFVIAFVILTSTGCRVLD